MEQECGSDIAVYYSGKEPWQGCACCAPGGGERSQAFIKSLRDKYSDQIEVFEEFL